MVEKPRTAIVLYGIFFTAIFSFLLGLDIARGRLYPVMFDVGMLVFMFFVVWNDREVRKSRALVHIMKMEQAVDEAEFLWKLNNPDEG